MREMRIIFKKASCRRGGAHIRMIYKRWKRFSIPVYWQITLMYGHRACANHDDDWVRCINHECMHAILDEVIGEDANYCWDNIVKKKYSKNYGWKNIMGKWLPDVYCDEDGGK